MYFLLIITLALALLLIFNTLASILATLLCSAAASSCGSAFKLSAQQKSQGIFALRIFPTAAAIVFITAFLLPAYFLFEPNKSGEVVSVKLIVLALVSVLGIVLAFYKVFLTSRATRQLLQNWLLNAKPIVIEGISVPVYSIEHPFPVIAVVGAVRPKMFIAQQIFDLLEASEIKAAVAHEQGHLVSQDNLKRALMRFCRDLILIPHGRGLERAWAENSEIAADEYAARTGGKTMALNLASALIKIARLVPAGTHPAMPAGAFLIGEQIGGVSGRIQNLLKLTESENPCASQSQIRSGIKSWIYLSCMISAVSLLAAHQTILLFVHETLEIVVKLLR